MKYRAILKIRDKEIPILYYSYRCHIPHYDDSNLSQIIRLHIEACEKIGNREYLPVEGDLITLMFECSGDEQFFYDWLNEGVMHNGEIHFVYNEVEIADIFQFWDCFCLNIEESMSALNSPMVMTVYLSPGIIKRNNLEPREKVWKVSEITPIVIEKEAVDDRIIYIVDAYWIDEYGIKHREIYVDRIVTLFVKFENYIANEHIVLEFEDDMICNKGKKIFSGYINEFGLCKIDNFELTLPSCKV